MSPAEKTPELSDSPGSDPRYRAIFDNAFEFIGTLDGQGRGDRVGDRLFTQHRQTILQGGDADVRVRPIFFEHARRQ